MSEKNLKFYLIPALIQWSKDSQNTACIKVENHPNNKLPEFLLSNSNNFMFRVGGTFSSEIKYMDDGLSFITSIENEEQEIYLDYNCIKSVSCFENQFGLSFDSIDLFTKQQDNIQKNINRKNNLKLVVDNSKE